MGEIPDIRRIRALCVAFEEVGLKLTGIAAVIVLLAPPTALAAEREVIGESVQGRKIVAQHWDDPTAERSMLVVGSIHGDETEGHRVVKALTGAVAHDLEGVDLWTIKTVNPDGVAANTRGNAHGVDLNRNFGFGWTEIPPSSGYYSGPGPFSEPESRAMKRFLKRVKPDVTVWYHQPWGVTLVPCNRSRETALEYARISGLRPRDCDTASYPGSVTSWQNHELRAISFVVELAAENLSRGQLGRHVRAVTEIAEG